ncbi:antitoxin Xre/MbcA/ParS toxin-binding domain-containing protein [Deinococcus sp. SM5_A1]|uniref:antitoxin Xre/MbcA/ParS toxin-binding domain-containing protein n=1 Tax=Deinococcus sp. SM5_A1 TaxID=3379094 RepID=UPI00385D595A
MPRSADPALHNTDTSRATQDASTRNGAGQRTRRESRPMPPATGDDRCTGTDSIFETITHLRQPPGPLLMARKTDVAFAESDIPTYRETSDRIRDLLNVTLESTADVLGVSRASASKNTPLSVDALDRVHSLSVNLERVQAVFGEQTVDWFTAPHSALGGLSPLELQRTRYGERKLATFIQNMLDGAFL